MADLSPRHHVHRYLRSRFGDEEEKETWIGTWFLRKSILYHVLGAESPANYIAMRINESLTLKAALSGVCILQTMPLVCIIDHENAIAIKKRIFEEITRFHKNQYKNIFEIIDLI